MWVNRNQSPINETQMERWVTQPLLPSTLFSEWQWQDDIVEEASVPTSTWVYFLGGGRSIFMTLQLLLPESIYSWNTDVCISVEASQSLCRLPGEGHSLLICLYLESVGRRRLEAAASEGTDSRLALLNMWQKRRYQRNHTYLQIYTISCNPFDVSPSRRVDK